MQEMKDPAWTVRNEQPLLWHYLAPLWQSPCFLCDNQVLLNAVKRWVGEGGKAILLGAPDADILREFIEEPWKGTTAGAATFLVKVKAYRGEPANEEAGIQAYNFISSKEFPMEWYDRTNRAVFSWQEPRRKGGKVSYKDQNSTWSSRVWPGGRQLDEDQPKRRCASTGIV